MILTILCSDKAGARGMKWRTLPAGFLLIWLITGCQLIKGSDPYDSRREEQINSYHTKVVAFVANAEKASGTDEGKYTAEGSRNFYSEQRAALANLIVNAEASDKGRLCPTASFRVLIPSIQTLEREIGSEVAPDSAAKPEQTGCTLIVLRHLKLTHDVLEEIHKENIYLTAPASELALGAVEDAVRIALRNESAKK